MAIMKIEIKDYAKAAELLKYSWENNYIGIVTQNYFSEINKTKELESWIYKPYHNDIRLMYGEYIESELIGFGGASQAEKEDAKNGIEINYLFVKNEYRLSGIGKRLLKYILAELKYRNHYSIVIIYNLSNAKSNNYYRWLGDKVKRKVSQQIENIKSSVDVLEFNMKELSK